MFPLRLSSCLQSFVALIAMGVMSIGIGAAALAADRPNVVWIMSEDNSKHYLAHFDPHGAPTPHIESMAAHGITFDRAFSNAPVCSVARTTLITGCYGPSIATTYHRPIAKATLDDDRKMFPALLRAAGYYTTNANKEDYNVVKSPDVWDRSSNRATWKKRSDGQPFFHVQTIKTTHESQLHFSREDMQTPPTTDPASITLPSYFPDTDVFRYTAAKYHDLITKMDTEVGQILDELSSADVIEDTFVFYFGDHGGVLPRSKGYLYESGLHVPLVIRIPANFADKIDRTPGDRTAGFVSFVDFAPTVLELAGVRVPITMDGEPFLGGATNAAEVDRRNETLGYADRMDEKYDMLRSIRIDDMKYIRNFTPIYPAAAYNEYRYRMLAYQQWRNMEDEGTLDEIQSQFFQQKSPEELYDLADDPDENHNLADDPSHRNDLLRLRSRLMQSLAEMRDLGFMTELYLVDDAMADPVEYGQTNRAQIARYIETANLCLQPFEQIRGLLVQSIDDADPLIRYWAITAASAIGPEADELIPQIQGKMLDVEPFVVAKAIEFCVTHGAGLATGTERFDDVRPFMYRSLNRVLAEAEALEVLRTANFLAEQYSDRIPLDSQRTGLDMLKPAAGTLSSDASGHLQTLGSTKKP